MPRLQPAGQSLDHTLHQTDRSLHHSPGQTLHSTHAAPTAPAAPAAGDAGEPNVSPPLPPGARAGLVALSAAAFLVSLDRSIFAPLLPAIAADLNATIGAAGLAVTAYVLPYGFFQLFYGPVADRVGKIAVVRWAVLVFAAGTALCGLAPGLLWLDLWRAITGACAAAVIPLSLAYIGDVVPYGRRQGTVATLMGVTSLGTALSTAVGGLVGNFLSWRMLFATYGLCSLLDTLGLFLVPVGGQPGQEGAAGAAGGGAPGRWERYLEVLRVGRARLLYLLVAA
ncbi:MAG TPA: MFS transporter, partial [Chloroflexota bacterium]|nr:MFS transporter [Chloroflexota bacterium]